MLIAAKVVFAALLALGIAGYAGIRNDKWYKDKIRRSQYPFESEVLSEAQKKEMDDLIREFRKK